MARSTPLCTTPTRKFRRRRWLLAALALGVVVSAPAQAACTGPTATATALAFGNYNPGTGSDVTSNGSITIACALLLESLPPLTIGLSTGGSNSYSPRHLSFGVSNLNYNLFTSPTFVTVWGDGTSLTQTESYNSGARTVTLTVYGQIPKSQFVTPGAYSDTITVTVTY